MVSKSSKAAFFILLNILFLPFVSPHKVTCPPKSPSSSPAVPKRAAKCPEDTLKFGVCGSWLGLVHEVVGSKPSKECCALIEGLADVEAALCLCTAIKANMLGVIKMRVPIALSLVVNSCGKKVPDGFICP